MSEVINGGGGIPIAGREVEYATELWLDDPSAFWLHPEGPLSDKTPDEWRAEDLARKEAEQRDQTARWINSLEAQRQMVSAQYNFYRSQLQNAPRGYYNLGDLLNAAPGALMRYRPF